MDTQSKNTYLHTPMRARTHKLKHTNTPLSKQMAGWGEMTQLLLSVTIPPSHPFSHRFIHFGHLQGGWKDGLSLIGHKWGGFMFLGGGVKQKKRRGEWKEGGILYFLCEQFGLKLIIDACCTITLFCISQLIDKSTCVHVGYTISGCVCLCVCRQIDSVLSLAGLQPCAVSSN